MIPESLQIPSINYVTDYPTLVVSGYWMDYATQCIAYIVAVLHVIVYTYHCNSIQQSVSNIIHYFHERFLIENIIIYFTIRIT